MTQGKKYVKGRAFTIIKISRETLSTVILCRMCRLEKSMLEIGRLIFSMDMACIYFLLESATKAIQKRVKKQARGYITTRMETAMKENGQKI